MKPLLFGVLMATAGSAVADSITFYQDDNYQGRQFTADRPVSNFARGGFNDTVHSAVVHDGRWEICMDADYGGSCSVLAPGAYPSLGAYSGRISSVRPVDGTQSGMRGDDRGWNRDGRDGRDRRDGRDGRDARATLYEGTNLSGRSYSLDEAMPNLRATGFNDRASSLHVDSGYWIFCTDAEFRGECRTFGPGDYASLPSMNNVISSGRRISNVYPYQDKPDWQRDWYRQPQSNDNRR